MVRFNLMIKALQIRVQTSNTFEVLDLTNLRLKRTAIRKMEVQTQHQLL